MNNKFSEFIKNELEKMQREGLYKSERIISSQQQAEIEVNHDQRMLTPLEEAKILQALALTGKETVLEIGTGTGFFTAMLSCLAQKVISLDYYQDFILDAQQKLTAYHIKNVELINNDAYRGFVDYAPYEVIVYTGALTTIEDSHRLQVLPGGKLFAIVGTEPVMQGQLHTLHHNGVWHYEVLFETNTPLLLNKSRAKEFIF